MSEKFLENVNRWLCRSFSVIESSGRGGVLPMSWSLTPVFLLFASLLLLPFSQASAVTYTNAATTFSWIDASTHTQVGHNTVPYKFSNTGGCGSAAPTLDDTLSDNIPIGFTFNFGGVDFTDARIMSNGRLQFNNNTTCGYGSPVTQLPYPDANLNYTVRIYGNDLDHTAKSEVPAYNTNCLNRTTCYVSYATIGTTPNRQFVVTWYHVPEWTAAATASGSYDLQIILKENGEFVYQFGNDTPGPGNTNAQVGWQVNTTDYAVPNVGFPTVNSAIRFYIPSALAEFRMDESAWSGAGSVINNSGGANGSPVGLAQTVVGGKVCRGGDIPSNTTTAAIDAIDTGYDVDTQIGSSGTISFWYKSNGAWNGGGSQDSQLFDATVVNNRWFYLVKQNGNGRLSFNLTDSGNNNFQVNTGNNAFAANTWVHVAVSWKLTPVAASNSLKIYLNGALAQSTAIGTINPLSPSIGTLYLGDNRSSFITNPGTGKSANGVIDEVRIYNYEVTPAIVLRDYNATHACAAFDHIKIEHATGSGVTCTPSTLTLKACADAACSSLYTGGVTGTLTAATTGTANWEGGTANFTIPASGSLTKTLQLTAANVDVTATLGATSSAPNPTSCSFAGCLFTAYNAGFIFNVPDHVAEVLQTINVSAVKKADNSLACTPAFASVSKNVTFKCAYTNPASGTLPVRVNGAALNATNDAALACDVGGRAVSLAFDATGVASTTIQYADVGNMSLAATYTGSGGDAGLSMTGSDTFIAAPKDFAFSSVTAAPITAGKNFTAKLTARNNAGNATPNFGQESSPETATISFVKNDPTGTSSSAGTFTSSVSAFGVPVASGGQGPGAALATMTWSEVGKIDLTATLTDAVVPDGYLASGLLVSGTQAAVGRFKPDHFDVVVTQGCAAGSFTYSGQPFTVKVTAMNGAATPEKTQNYDGSANTSPNYANQLTLSDANAAGVGTLAPTTLAANLFDKGVATLSTPTYTFAVVKTVPTTIKLRAVETAGDSVTSSGALEGTAVIRSGRLQLGSAYGSELLDLPIPLEAQYWAAGGYYVTNRDDACTSFNISSIILSSFTQNLSACETQFSPTGSQTLAGGKLPLRLTRPGAGNNGSVSLALNVGAVASGSTCVSGASSAATAANLPWFGGVNPAGRATFGVYRTPLIYRRESY
jgi:MSHA biogenesis protein MshQ